MKEASVSSFIKFRYFVYELREIAQLSSFNMIP